MNVLDLEQRDIELQLQEIQLKRRVLAIEREKLENEFESTTVTVSVNTDDLDIEELKEKLNAPEVNEHSFDPRVNCKCTIEPVSRAMYLHYSKSAKENIMKILGVTPEGCILVNHSNNSSIISKKYNIRSMKWIKTHLPKWAKLQKTQMYFWVNIAAKYSRKFLEGDSISRTTIEKLCYLVDSGKMDKWFDEYEVLKNHGAQQLQLEECK